MAEQERWSYRVTDFKTGTPWKYTEHEETPGAEAAPAAPPPIQMVPPMMVPVVPRAPAGRAFYVKRANIEQLGAHPGCPACLQI
eukprot:4397986-Amphidinium_carterae.1